jgi:para-nitrobenzyl esterase
MAGDRFIAFSTWRWAELQAKTNSPVYRYYFTRARPGLRADINKTQAESENAGYQGASHSAEIEYALGNLPTNRVYDWQPDDYLVSEIMQNYFLNFIKTKNPNGLGLPHWPLYQSWQKDPVQWIGIETRRHPDNRERYLYLEKTANQ